MLCPTCTGLGAPRPSGTQTFTYAGVTHKAAECAAISSVGETPIRTRGGYATKSGLAVCIECFPYGLQHTYTLGQDPHEHGDPVVERMLGVPKPERPRGPDIGKRRPRLP